LRRSHTIGFVARFFDEIRKSWQAGHLKSDAHEHRAGDPAQTTPQQGASRMPRGIARTHLCFVHKLLDLAGYCQPGAPAGYNGIASQSGSERRRSHSHKKGSPAAAQTSPVCAPGLLLRGPVICLHWEAIESIEVLGVSNSQAGALNGPEHFAGCSANVAAARSSGQ
jgi:hypothetical protein